MDRKSSAVPALDKMDLIFDMLASAPEGLSQKDLSSGLGIPKATVFRMIKLLSELGYLEQNHISGLYTLGPKLLSLGNIVGKRLDISAVSRSWLENLSNQTDEMVKLSVLRGDTVYPLRSCESSKPVRITLDSGTVYPPYIGAAGKLLMALTKEGKTYRQVHLSRRELIAYTPYTITDRIELDRVLRIIEEERIAFDRQEESEGIYAMAMPVYNSLGETVAAVSIPFFGDFEAKIEKYRPMLEECTKNISRSMGYLEE